ncbi:50S ribosomal protein L3 [Candidatus Woesearchaeota archaeon]|nr:50S ribosomal protein L3 [Candidatus Woesearchaeota archaeon]
MKKRNPRHGSMQFWPRVRAKREHARVRRWNGSTSILGFAGYKVGMTHLMITDNKSTSKTKGQDIFCPATIIECPPLKTAAIRFYKKTSYGPKALSHVFADTLDKDLAKRLSLPKKQTKKADDIKNFDDIRLIVHTQPKLTGIGKKKPEVFEIALGGKKEEKLAYAKEKLGKDISLADVFKEGEQLDIHAVTKGKGFQGPVKRFGVTLRSHKSEKVRRGPGSLGGWKGQGHVMYRVAHAGQTGYHQRTEYNKWLLKIGAAPKEVHQDGGFIRYGVIKNTYLIVKGSVAGSKKRLIKFSHAIRPDHTLPKDAPAIAYISTRSKQ